MVRYGWVLQVIASAIMVTVCIVVRSPLVFINLALLIFGVLMLASHKEPTP